MHAIGTLIYKDGYRSIGTGVRNNPGHGLHDERVAHDYAHALRIAVYAGFGKYRAATFAVNSTMFGLPIASSTAARTASNGFREIMLHRCTFT